MKTLVIRHVLMATMGLAVAFAASSDANAALLAHWSFDETSGTALTDSTGNHNGAAQNGLTGSVNAGVIGNAWSFTGGAINTESEYVSVMPGSLTDLTEMTMMTWFKTTSSGPGMMLAISNTTVGSAEFGLRINDLAQFGAVGGPQYLARHDPGGPDIFGGAMAAANDDQWHHVAAALSASGWSLYVDGQLVNSGPDVANPTSIGANMVQIGRNQDSGGPQWYYNGLTDDMAVFSTALDGDLIGDVYRGGLQGRSVIEVIPEPASIVLMAVGGLLLLRRYFGSHHPF
ncbi:MAG: LamG domain-containing protein [Pirellulales bacterium]